MKLHAFTPLLAAVALSALTVPASAQVHRCVDAQGKVSFSDTLCDGIRAQKVFSAGSTAKGWLAEGYKQQATGDAAAQRMAQASAASLPGRPPASTQQR